MIIENLIAQRLIKEGTWVGLCNGDRPVIKRLSVQHITQDNKLVVIDHVSNSMMQLDPNMIAEIDGMRIDRYLAQADLNSMGHKITGIKRRGRKPKNPRPQ